MPLKLIENIWKSNENGLGFYLINIFQKFDTDLSLKNLLQSNILNDTQFGDYKLESIPDPTKVYSSIILDKIEVSDFKILDFQELRNEISEYWTDDNWGADLPIFKENFEIAIKKLYEYSENKRTYYYINIEKINPEKLAKPNFFTYLISIISTLENSDKIITLTFGLD